MAKSVLMCHEGTTDSLAHCQLYKSNGHYLQSNTFLTGANECCVHGGGALFVYILGLVTGF